MRSLLEQALSSDDDDQPSLLEQALAANADAARSFGRDARPGGIAPRQAVDDVRQQERGRYSGKLGAEQAKIDARDAARETRNADNIAAMNVAAADEVERKKAEQDAAAQAVRDKAESDAFSAQSQDAQRLAGGGAAFAEEADKKETDRRKEGGPEEPWTDAGRSMVSGLVKGVGMIPSGMAEGSDAATRTLRRLAGTVGAEGAFDVLMAPAEALGVTRGARAVGEAIEGVGDRLNVSQEKQGRPENIIANAVGQLGGQLVIGLAGGPEAGIASYIAQGFDQIADTVREKGKEGTLGSDLATLSGGGITGLTEKWGINRLLDRVPPKIKNALLRGLTDVVVAGGNEAGQEVAEQILQNVAVKLGTDSDQDPFEGLTQSAIGGGGAGVVGRIALGALGVHGHSFREPTAPGHIEEETAASQATPDDLASPLSSVLDLGHAKTAIAGARGKLKADEIMDRNIAPPTGTMVEFAGKRWTVEDAGTDENGEDFTTISHQGQKQKVYFKDLDDAGETLTPIADPRETQPVAPLDAAVQQATGELIERPTHADNLAGAGATLKARIKHVESHGDPNAKNPNSSASGTYQFTNDTFDRYYRKVYGTAPTADVRNDPAVQERLMDSLVADNTAALTRAGFEANAGNLYLAHFLGSGGATSILRNPNGSAEAILGEKVAKANASIIRGKTGAELAAWAARKMGGSGALAAAGADPVGHFEDGTPTHSDSTDFLNDTLPDDGSPLAAAVADAAGPTPEEQQKSFADKMAELEGKPAEPPTRPLYRGVPENVDDNFRVHDRGPFGHGVYMSGQPGVAAMYGPKVIEADVTGHILDGVRGRVTPELEQAVKEQMTPEEQAKLGRWSTPRGIGDFIDRISRSVESHRMPEIFGALGYHGIEANVDGHEVSVFDPKRIAERAPPALDDGKGTGTQGDPRTIEHAGDLELIGQHVDTPTEAQAAAGNYSHGHADIQGLKVSIENPAGTTRKGTDAAGNAWETTLPAAYGYIRKTEGGDGEHFDVYVGPNPQSPKVYVVDQFDPKTGKWDEHKGVLGADSREQAIGIYDAGFSDGSGPKRRGTVTEMSVDDFKTYLAGDTTKPAGNPSLAQSRKAEAALPAAIAPEASTQAAEQQSDNIGNADATAPAGAEVASEVASELPSSGQPAAPQQTDAPAEKPFVAQDHIANLRRYVQNPRNPVSNVDHIAKKLGLTKPQAQKVLDAYAAHPKSNLYYSRSKGRIRRKPTRSGPTSLYDFIRDMGGMTAPDGHALTVGRRKGTESGKKRSGRDLHLSHIGLINNKSGVPFYHAFEAAAEAGYFGTTDMGQLVETDFLDALENARNHYLPGDQFEADEKRDAEEKAKNAITQHAELWNDLDLHIKKDAELRGHIGPISESDREAIIDIMDRHGLDPAEAVVAHYELLAHETLDAGSEETGDNFYDMPQDWLESEHDRQGHLQGDGGEEAAQADGRPESDAGDQGKGEAAGADHGAAGEGSVNTGQKRDITGEIEAEAASIADGIADSKRRSARAQPDDKDLVAAYLTATTGKKVEGTDLDLPWDEWAKIRGQHLADAQEWSRQRRAAAPKPDAKEGSLGLTADEAQTGQTPEQQRQAAELAARQQQQKARKGGQVGLGDQSGGLFSNERDQGDLLAQPATKPAEPIAQARAALQQAMEALDVAENRKPETMIEDAGEKIGGARKDRWAERGMDVSDLEGMSQGEAFQLVTKDAVWPKPDYGKMVADGVPAEVAAGIKLLRDGLAAKPRVDSEQGRRDYVEMMGAVRQILADVRTMDDFRGTQKAFEQAAGFTDEVRRDPVARKAGIARLFSIIKGSTANLQLDYADRRKAAKMVEEGFPEKGEPWKRRFEVRQWGAGTYRVRGKGKTGRSLPESYASREEAEAAAKAAYEALSKNVDGTKKAPERPHLDEIARTGEDVRGGRDIDSHDFIKDFGFRGIEYGNWVASDERQKSTNLAYEALHDLANTLGIPPRALSLGGQLGLAFGARGTRFAAHYEPGKLVINLTKMNGAGALAHEWGHALDHYFGTLDTDLGTRGAPKGASGWYDKTPSRLVALGNLRPEMAQAFDKLMATIFTKDQARAQMVRDAELRIEKLQAGIAKQRADIAKAQESDGPHVKKFVKQSEDWIALQDRALLAAGQRLADLTDETKPITAAKVSTSYYLNATALSGKQGSNGYWARPTELLARSFESYVFDKIGEKGNVSQYLVQGVEDGRYANGYAGDPYPAGPERQAINAAYDDLFKTMQVRDEGEEKQLYSLGGSGEEVFYSALERTIEASPLKRASAAQWAATLGKTPGIKKEELEWSGLFDFLDMQTGPVDREAVLGVVRDNGIKVEEVVLGGPVKISQEDIDRRAQEIADARADDVDWNDDDEARQDWINSRWGNFSDLAERELQDWESENGPQFKDWSSDPRSATYRELLITLPPGQGSNPTRAPSTHWDTDAVVAHARFMDKTDADGNRVLFVEEVQSDWHQKGRDEGYAQKAAPEQVARLRDASIEASAKYDDARQAMAGALNAVDPEEDAGPSMPARALSLRYQEHLKRDTSAYPIEQREALTAAYNGMVAAELREREAGQALNNAVRPNGIPEAPFKATWPALVMKRMISWAATNGYDKIAWTTGAEQAERYNLSEAVGSIRITRAEEGTVARTEGQYSVILGSGQRAYDTLVENGMAKFNEFGRGLIMTPDQMKQAFGGEIAGKLVAGAESAGTQEGVITRMNDGGYSATEAPMDFKLEGAENLRIGGDGMKQFYDRNLVNITNDIVKKYGVKVEKTSIVDGREIVDTSDDAELNEIRARASAAHRAMQEVAKTIRSERPGMSRNAEEIMIRADPRFVEAESRFKAIRTEEDARKKVVLAAIAAERSNPSLTITPALREAAQGGFPLFNRDADINATDAAVGASNKRGGLLAHGEGLGPRTLESREAEWGPRLRAALEHYGVADRILLRLVANLENRPNFHGSYYRRVITVALESGAKNPLSVFNHEVVHALRALNVFKPAEWAALVKEVNSRPELMADIRRRYAKEKLSDMGLEEEAIADLFRDWTDARKAPKGFLAAALQRVKDLIHAVTRAFSDQITTGDVFHDIESGKIGRRPTGAGSSARMRPQYSAGSITDTPAFKRWFGDSKVLNDDGEPGIVHHFTYNDFDTFDRQWAAKEFGRDPEGVDTLGSWFTDNPKARYVNPEWGGARKDVYLSVKRPLYVDDIKEGDGFVQLQDMVKEAGGSSALRARLQSEGYDGIVLNGTKLDGVTQNAIIAFEPSQIKSVDNRGTFDPADDRIMFSIDQDIASDTTMTGILNRTQDATGAMKLPTTWDKIATAVDDIRTAMQDRMLPGLRAEVAAEKVLGRKLTEAERPYMQEELMTGRVGAALERLTDDLVEPLFDTMREEKVNADELDTFLYARHAPERNAHIAKINPEFAQGEGSGMTDLEAKAIMARIAKAGRMEAFERVAAKVDAIRDFNIDYRVQTGLMSEQQAAEWKSRWEHYVPLKGFAENPDGDARPQDSKGISVRGAESKQAFGRRSAAADLLAHTIMQAEEGIARGQKNLVGQAFYKLAQQAKDKGFWRLHKVSVSKRLNNETGLVENHLNTDLQPGDEPYTVFLKIDGEHKRVTMMRGNQAAERLAAAMRRLDDTKMNGLIKLGSTINRYLSAANTSLNPEFVISNAFRDIEEASVNLSGFDVKGLKAGTLKDYPAAMKASMKGAFKKDDGGEWAKAWREFTDAGGRVFYNQIQDVGELRKDIEKRMTRSMIGATGKARTPKEMAMLAKGDIAAVFHFIENVNLGVENAIRLAAFKNARQRGMTAAEAASLAKNLTINFNRHGAWGVGMNAAYLFYNASTQGTVRILTAMKHKKVRRVVYGMMLSGLLLDMLNRLLSDDDKDGEKFYDKISDFEKSRNLIVMNPAGGSRYLKIPLPYGYNSFFAIGRGVSELIHGKDFGSVFGNMAGTIVDAFNPIGGTQSIANFIAPTVLDPAVDLERNRDYADRPIMPDQPQFGPGQPDNQRYWGSVGPQWKAITDFLNTASGGDKVVPGKVDVSPETLEYLFGVVTGAAGSFVDRVAGAGAKVGQIVDGNPDVELSINDIPMGRKLIGEKAGYIDKAAFYARLESVETAVHQGKEYIAAGDREGLEAFKAKESDVLHAAAGAKQARKEMRLIRKERRALDAAKERGRVDDDRYKEMARTLKQRETRVIDAFDKFYLATVKDPVGAE